jgi:hypothetical protein
MSRVQGDEPRVVREEALGRLRPNRERIVGWCVKHRDGASQAEEVGHDPGLRHGLARVLAEPRDLLQRERRLDDGLPFEPPPGVTSGIQGFAHPLRPSHRIVQIVVAFVGGRGRDDVAKLIKVRHHPFRSGQLRRRLVGTDRVQRRGDEGLQGCVGAADEMHASLLQGAEYPVRPWRAGAVAVFGLDRFSRHVDEPADPAESGGEVGKRYVPCFGLLPPCPQGETEAEHGPAVSESLNQIVELGSDPSLLQLLGGA